MATLERRRDAISHSAPTGVRPARRARSTAASVCPGRRRTPPARARSGSTWPGRTRSCGPSSSRRAGGWCGPVGGGDSGGDARLPAARSASARSIGSPLIASPFTVHPLHSSDPPRRPAAGRSTDPSATTILGPISTPYRASGVHCNGGTEHRVGPAGRAARTTSETLARRGRAGRGRESWNGCRSRTPSSPGVRVRVRTTGRAARYRSPLTRAPSHRQDFVENRCTVTCWYSSSGRRTVEGKFGWFGESGKCWVSKQKP
jgi:hypothetical protein